MFKTTALSLCLVVSSAAIAACGSAPTQAQVSGDSASAASSTTSELSFGGHSKTVEARSEAAVEYTFRVHTAGAKADVSVFATTTSGFPTYSDTKPPTSLELLRGGQSVDGTASDWDPKGGSTAITAYRRLIATNLAVGTYTIRYVPVVGEGYSVDLEGNDGMAAGATCTVKGTTHPVRGNPDCAQGLVCFGDANSGTCAEPTNPNAGCSTADTRNAHAASKDECTDGYYCKYSHEATQGDEGWNGYCTKDDR
jgi:hypothetical protein